MTVCELSRKNYFCFIRMLLIYALTILIFTIYRNSIETVASPYKTILNEQEPARNKSTKSTKSKKGYEANERLSYVEKVIQQRLQNVRDVCAKTTKADIRENYLPMGEVWSSIKHGIHYCSTPKIGCTYWKQVMRFISGDYDANLNISKPEDIDRHFAHAGHLENIRINSLKSAMARRETSKGRSFMFVREPYSRLWSAYIDKFLLPDFWRWSARAVINTIRSNATDHQRECANDVTFSEFLQFIVASNPQTLNEHWAPISKMCDPCHVAYDVIGKQETFVNDSQFILQKFGLGNLISATSSKAFEEMMMLVKYNFYLEHYMPKGCFDKEDVATRLWKAFQYNGYIHRSMDIPIKSTQPYLHAQNPTEIFLKHALEILKFQHVQNLDIRNQKRNMMIETYKSIPKNLIQSIQKVYANDFELFGYDKSIFDDV